MFAGRGGLGAGGGHGPYETGGLGFREPESAMMQVSVMIIDDH